jgi:hypothetical protein
MLLEQPAASGCRQPNGLPPLMPPMNWIQPSIPGSPVDDEPGYCP